MKPGTTTVPSEPSNTPLAKFPESDASVLLDLVRGLAAIIVLVGHWKNIFL